MEKESLLGGEKSKTNSGVSFWQIYQVRIPVLRFAKLKIPLLSKSLTGPFWNGSHGIPIQRPFFFTKMSPLAISTNNNTNVKHW